MMIEPIFQVVLPDTNHPDDPIAKQEPLPWHPDHEEHGLMIAASSLDDDEELRRAMLQRFKL